MNRMLIRLGCSEMFKLFQSFKRFIGTDIWVWLFLVPEFVLVAGTTPYSLALETETRNSNVYCDAKPKHPVSSTTIGHSGRHQGTCIHANTLEGPAVLLLVEQLNCFKKINLVC